METDGYALFTEFHRIYIRGIRRSFQERLEAVFGDDWFQRAVLPAVTDTQRTNLNAALEKGYPWDNATLLDAGHFGRIVRWNHAAVFAEIFTEIDHTLRQFRFLSAMRNDWAHIPSDDLPIARVVSAIQTMQALLVTLRCREALEIGRLMLDRNLGELEASSIVLPPSAMDSDDDDIGNDDGADTLTNPPLGLWHALRSYLVAEAFVSPASGEQVLVTVRVSNVAPASEDRPQIYFENVLLEAKPNRPAENPNRRGRGDSANHLGALGPGQSVERQFTLHDKEVAYFEYRVSAGVDTQRYFGIQQKGSLPAQVVRPILNEFSTRFEAIGVKEPLDQALSALTVVAPTMTLADAAQVRRELEHANLLIEERRNTLGQLFDEFFLDRESPLGASVREVVLLLEQLETRIRAVDNAIGQTDLEAIKRAVSGLEQSQLSVLQVEETIRKMLAD